MGAPSLSSCAARTHARVHHSATIGAVGVSGAPGGEIDEACAQEALDALVDRIEFAE